MNKKYINKDFLDYIQKMSSFNKESAFEVNFDGL